MSKKHNEDYEAVRIYLSGTAKEQEQVGYCLFGKTYNYLIGYLNEKYMNEISSEDKEDLVDDTFCICIEKLDHYNGDSSFATWACGILKNLIKNYFKKNRTKDKYENNIIDLSDRKETDLIMQSNNYFGKNPLAIIIEQEIIGAYNQAYEMLKPEYKDIIRYKGNGMKSRQIAQLANKSVDAIDSMHYKARKELKNNFKKIYKSGTDFYC